MKKYALSFLSMFLLLNFWLVSVYAMPLQSQLIIINKHENKLAFFDQGLLIKSYDVGTGRTPSLTPEGKFKIVQKVKNRPYYKGHIKGGDPKNPLGDRWMGLSVPGTEGYSYGIHGNNNEKSIGRYVSSGCIRMHNSDARSLYEKVNLYTPVIIVDSKQNFEALAKANGYPLGASEATAETVKVDLSISVADSQTSLYTNADLGSWTPAKLSAQTLSATEKSGDWFKVKTWLGDRWIHLNLADQKPNFSIQTDEINMIAAVDKTVSLKALPFDDAADIASLLPQNVKVKSKVGGWLQTDTPSGQAWFKNNGFVLSVPAAGAADTQNIAN